MDTKKSINLKLSIISEKNKIESLTKEKDYLKIKLNELMNLLFISENNNTKIYDKIKFLLERINKINLLISNQKSLYNKNMNSLN